MNRIVSILLVASALTAPSSTPTAQAQQGASYDTLIQQGNAQLQSGNAAQAETLGEQAIKADPKRWEAYALTGGALKSLKRYEAAEDQLSKAIEFAPAAKQDALRNLRKQCVLAETGTTPPPAASAAASTTQAEFVMWKSIENSTNPADFQTYLDQYPSGAFVALAHRHLSEVQAQSDAMAQKRKEQADAEQEAERKRMASFSVKHFVATMGTNMRDGVLVLVPGGIEYRSEKDKGFQEACSSISSLALGKASSSEYGKPAEIKTAQKRYQFYQGDSRAGSIVVTSSDLLSHIAEHCNMAAPTLPGSTMPAK